MPTAPSDAPIGTVRADPNGRRLAISQSRNGQREWWIQCLYTPHELGELRGVWREIESWPVVYSPGLEVK